MSNKLPDELEKLRKQGLLMWGNDLSLDVEFIPFGLPELDEILGGGVPRSRFTILTGEFSSGKTLLQQLLIKSAMEKGLRAAFIDCEQTFDKGWWEKVGVNTEGLLVSQPATGEDATNVAAALSAAGVDLICLDSITAMTPKVLAEEDAEKSAPAAHARLVQRFIQKMLSLKSRAAVVCTNQLRSGLSPGVQMSGGYAVKHYSGLTMRVWREGWIEPEGKREGFYIHVSVPKSKVGTPFGECLLPFRFRGFIDVVDLTIGRALDRGLVTRNGAWYTLFEQRVQGRSNLVAMLEENSDLMARLTASLGELDAAA